MVIWIKIFSVTIYPLQSTGSSLSLAFFLKSPTPNLHPSPGGGTVVLLFFFFFSGGQAVSS